MWVFLEEKLMCSYKSRRFDVYLWCFFQVFVHCTLHKNAVFVVVSLLLASDEMNNAYRNTLCSQFKALPWGWNYHSFWNDSVASRAKLPFFLEWHFRPQYDALIFIIWFCQPSYDGLFFIIWLCQPQYDALIFIIWLYQPSYDGPIFLKCYFSPKDHASG